MKTIFQHNKKDLMNLMNEYKFELDNLNYDDDFLQIVNSVNNLSDPDKIILYLYSELKSYRKLAKKLNVSFTTAYKAVHQIRNKILNNK